MLAFAPFLMLLADGPPKMGPATPVDLRVAAVDWRPEGDALVYERATDDGKALGVFATGAKEGCVVLPLGEKDRWNLQWFGAGPQALATVERPGLMADGKTLSLYLLDARRRTATLLFNRAVDAGATLDADLSPTLLHAILTLDEKGKRVHFVMPLGGGPLRAAPDLDRAEAKNLCGPSWSRRGTAYYTESSLDRSILFQILNGDTADVSVNFDSVGWVVDGGSVSGTFTVGELPKGSSGIRLTLMPPAAPEAGKPVAEVVPTNGVLRSVRSSGPALPPDATATDLATRPETMSVGLGLERTASRGLALTGGKGESAWRTVLAPRGDWGSLPRNGSAVAYAIDGALFVRPLGG